MFCIVDAYAEFGRRDESLRTPEFLLGSFSFSKMVFFSSIKDPGRALGVRRDAIAERGRRLDREEVRLLLRFDGSFRRSARSSSLPRNFCLDVGNADWGLALLLLDTWPWLRCLALLICVSFGWKPNTVSFVCFDLPSCLQTIFAHASGAVLGFPFY